jgi:hypothetical protein
MKEEELNRLHNVMSLHVYVEKINILCYETDFALKVSEFPIFYLAKAIKMYLKASWKYKYFCTFQIEFRLSQNAEFFICVLFENILN